MQKLRIGLTLSLSTACFIACSTPTAKVYEEFVRSSIAGNESAPEWVTGRIASGANEVSFVGRGGAHNVLDERKAFDEALMHARQQLAEFVGTRVEAELCDKDWAAGTRYMGRALTTVIPDHAGIGERPNQSIASRTWQFTDAIIGQLLPVDQHWEQWIIRDNGRATMRRYKCWVLASISSDTVDKFVAATIKTIENEAKIAKLEADNAAKAAELAAANDAHSRTSATHAEALAASEAARHAAAQEIQMLRERIHYGRAFRLTATDNCPVNDHCVPLDRSNWRTPAQIAPIVIHAPAPASMPAPAPAAPANAPCCELPKVGGH